MAIIEPVSEPKVILPFEVETIDKIFKLPLLIKAISPFARALSLLTSILILSFLVLSS